jgi:hypothetical protein
MDRLDKAVKSVLRDAGFDRKVNRTADPKRNTDRKMVGVAYLVQLHDALCDRPKADKLPLSVGQVKRRKDAEGFISAVVRLNLDELGVGIDCLNDAVSRDILGDDGGLEDISYRPVGVEREFVLVEVTGNVENWLERQEGDEKAG